MRIGGVLVDADLGARYRRGEGGELLAEITAPDPTTTYLRGLCLAALGKFDAAAEAFSACTSAFPIAAQVQRVLLDVSRHRGLTEAVEFLTNAAAQPDLDPDLLGSIWHVRGLAEGKLRRTAKAASALLESVRYYREAKDRWGIAHVRDTLGTVEAARGRLEQAVHCYAMALVDKSLLGDRLGMAITLGNLGRVHLRVGRFADAIECFERDLTLCLELGDVRGTCRMHNDLGRTWIANGDWGQGEEELQRGAQLAQQNNFTDIAFYCHKDLAALRIEQRRFDEARSELQQAKHWLVANGAAYLELMWNGTSGELMAAEGDARGIAVLQESVDAFHQAELPDWEIPVRIALAKALLDNKQAYAAERCLLAGMRLARTNGYVRYFSLLNEAMTRLGLSAGADWEDGKRILAAADQATRATDMAMNSTGGYLVREELGSGAFGTVYRAYDSQRGIEVALKVLRLATAYDVTLRSTLLESTKTEITAASRVRHPGVMRVYAIGHDPGGDVYICQELILGNSLRHLMQEEELPALGAALPILTGIAYALEALHAVHVFHRDLKPQNILIRNREQPVLIDFGIAQLKPRGWFDQPQFSGTLEYMAPEQSQGKSIDARADLYALGVIAYEWFTGRRPVRLSQAKWEVQASELQNQAPKPITIYRPDLPASFVTLVHQLLEKKPRRRPSSARIVAEQLQNLQYDYVDATRQQMQNALGTT